MFLRNVFLLGLAVACALVSAAQHHEEATFNGVPLRDLTATLFERDHHQPRGGATPLSSDGGSTATVVFGAYVVVRPQPGANTVDALRTVVGHDDVSRMHHREPLFQVFVGADGARVLQREISSSGGGSIAGATSPVASVHPLPPAAKVELALRHPQQVTDDQSSLAATLLLDAHVSHTLGADAVRAISQRVLAALQRRFRDPVCAVRNVSMPARWMLRVSVGAANADACAARVALAVAHAPEVRRVERTPRAQPLNVIATAFLQRGGSAPNQHPAWDRGITGRGQVVGVSDTGIDFDSCFFRDDTQPIAFYPAVNPSHRKIITYVEARVDERPPDHSDSYAGHGTHVAGSVAGNSLSDRAQFNGQAPDAKLVFVDVVPAGEHVLLPPADYDELLRVMVDAGDAGVATASWAFGATKSYNAPDRLADRALFLRPDVLGIFAAGNMQLAGVLSPSSAKNVLTIGSHLNSLDPVQREALSQFTTFGPTYDGRVKPDIVAPGGHVTSAMSDGLPFSNQCMTSDKEGTSMAAPQVAGVAALLRQYLAEGYARGGVANASNAVPRPSGALLKALLIHATRRMTQAGDDGAPVPNNRQGFGRLEAHQLLFFRDAAPGGHASVAPFLFFRERRVIRTTEQHAYCFSYSGSSVPATVADEIRATLVWIDAGSAAEGATMSVVNDLDLAVVTSNGALHRGNQRGGSAFDRVNTVEQVSIDVAGGSSSSGGTFRVVVFGFSVTDGGPYGGQPYALVVWAPGLTPVACGDGPAGTWPCAAHCGAAGDSSGGGASCGADGECRCKPGRRHVDCSACDADVACAGRGTCEVAPGGGVACTCFAHVRAASDSSCGACADGWYGAHCDFDGKCGAHGRFDEPSARCVCDNNSDALSSCWDGQRCDRCCFDRSGPSCSERSYWCATAAGDIRTVNAFSGGNGGGGAAPVLSGLLQITDERGQYANGQRCRWRLQPPTPHYRINVSVVSFSIESSYDWLTFADGATETVLDRWSGKVAAGRVFTAPALTASLLLIFDADTVGNDNGFVLRYTFVPPCAADPTCGGRGVCDAATGACACASQRFDRATRCSTCAAGWSGADCTVAVTAAPTPAPPTPAPSECGGAGAATCEHGGVCSGGECRCAAGFGGFRCAAACPTFAVAVAGQQQLQQLPCSGRGTCRASDAACACAAGAAGAACQVAADATVTLLPGVRPLATHALGANGEWLFVTFGVAPGAPAPPMADEPRPIRLLVVLTPPTAAAAGTAPAAFPPVQIAAWSSATLAGLDMSAAVATAVTANAAPSGSSTTATAASLSSSSSSSPSSTCLAVDSWRPASFVAGVRFSAPQSSSSAGGAATTPAPAAAQGMIATIVAVESSADCSDLIGHVTPLPVEPVVVERQNATNGTNATHAPGGANTIIVAAGGTSIITAHVMLIAIAVGATCGVAGVLLVPRLLRRRLLWRYGAVSRTGGVAGAATSDDIERNSSDSDTETGEVELRGPSAAAAAAAVTATSISVVAVDSGLEQLDAFNEPAAAAALAAAPSDAGLRQVRPAKQRTDSE